MTDRNIVVRDLIVHRYMGLNGVPNDQEMLVQQRYRTFQGENRSAFDYLEDLAVNLGDPKFVDRLDRLTNEFCEWRW